MKSDGKEQADRCAPEKRHETCGTNQRGWISKNSPDALWCGVFHPTTGLASSPCPCSRRVGGRLPPRAFFFRYGSKLYRDWHQPRLLQQAGSMLQQGRLMEATRTAREFLTQHPDSL